MSISRRIINLLYIRLKVLPKLKKEVDEVWNEYLTTENCYHRKFLPTPDVRILNSYNSQVFLYNSIKFSWMKKIEEINV